MLECVGHGQAVDTAIRIARPGGAVGRVGVPQEETMPASEPAFFGNCASAAGRPPRARTSRSCCPTSSTAASNPARCSTAPSTSTDVPDGYRAMAARESVKVMVTP